MAEELRGLSVRALRERAAEVGVDAAQVEEARDGDDPQTDLALLIAEHLRTAAAAADDAVAGSAGANDAVFDPTELSAELATLNVGTLRKRALSDGVAADVIEAARDGDDPKGDLVQLIVGQAERRHAEAAVSHRKRLEKELQALNVGALRKRAQAQGVGAAQVEAARDGDDPKAELIQLIVTQTERQPSIPEGVPGETAAAAPASPTAAASGKWSIGGPLGGQASIFEATDTETNESVVAKQHEEQEKFITEWENLKSIMQDREGKKRVMQLKGVDEHKMVLYLEKAAASLDSTLEGNPRGLDEAEVKPWIQKAIDILVYLHNSARVVHLDFKAANLLMFGTMSKPELKAGDMESATQIGAVRNIYHSPPICTPELAKQLTGGGGSLEVDPAEDIWDLGVLTLHLLTGAYPFGDDEAVVPHIAQLSQPDVDRIVLDAAKEQELTATPLVRFLNQCLKIDPHSRANISDLKTSGWISGNQKTQNWQAEKTSSSQKLNAMAKDVKEIKTDVKDIKVITSEILADVKFIKRKAIQIGDTVRHLTVEAGSFGEVKLQIPPKQIEDRQVIHLPDMKERADKHLVDLETEWEQLQREDHQIKFTTMLRAVDEQGYCDETRLKDMFATSMPDDPSTVTFETFREWIYQSLRHPESVSMRSVERSDAEQMYSSSEQMLSQVTQDPDIAQEEGRDAMQPKHGPILEMLPHGSKFDEPAKLAFDVARPDQDDDEEDAAFLVVLRKQGPEAPWEFPMEDGESLTVDADGRADLQIKSFSFYTTVTVGLASLAGLVVTTLANMDDKQASMIAKSLLGLGASKAAIAAVAAAAPPLAPFVAPLAGFMAPLAIKALRKAAQNYLASRQKEALGDSPEVVTPLSATSPPLTANDEPEPELEPESDDSSKTELEQQAEATLHGLGLTELRSKAQELGAEASDLDAATNGDSPKIALMSLIVSLTPAVIAERAELERQRQAQESIAKRRAEMGEFKLTDLEARAKEVGASGVGEAMDSDDPKVALIELLLAIPGGAIRWADGQQFDPQTLAAQRARVKVDGHGEGIVQAFKKSTFCATLLVFWCLLVDTVCIVLLSPPLLSRANWTELTFLFRISAANTHSILFNDGSTRKISLQRNGDNKTPFQVQVPAAVANEAELVAAVARGGEVLVRAGAPIELGEMLVIKTDCAIAGEPGGAAPPVLRRKEGSGNLIFRKFLMQSLECSLELRGLRVEGGGGEHDTAVLARGGRLAVRDCDVTWAGGLVGVGVSGGCQAELHGVTIHDCHIGVSAADNGTVCTLRGCTLRENGTDCNEYGGAKIVREEG
jgi:serine/threonine protein kinase